MISPFSIPGWNRNRYMLATAFAGVATLMAAGVPVGAMLGRSGPESLADAGYVSLGLAIALQLCRLGASNFRRPPFRRTCLRLLQDGLWGIVILSGPVLALDLAFRAGILPSSTGGRGSQGPFGVVALVFGVIAVIAAVNLSGLLRSQLWADFRAFALRPAD